MIQAAAPVQVSLRLKTCCYSSQNVSKIAHNTASSVSMFTSELRQSSNYSAEMPDDDMAPFFQKLDRFDLFKSLPKELRRIIWKLAMSPRRVRVNLRRDGTICHLKSKLRIPAVLMTSAESRETGLEKYKKFLVRTIPEYVNVIYIDYDQDTLVLPNTKFWLDGKHFLAFTDTIKDHLANVKILEVTKL